MTTGNRIHVVVKLRPVLDGERSLEKLNYEADHEGNSVRVVNKHGRAKEFKFDQILDGYATECLDRYVQLFTYTPSTYPYIHFTSSYPIIPTHNLYYVPFTTTQSTDLSTYLPIFI